MKFTLRLTQSLRGTDDWGYPAETLAVSKLLLLVIHFRIRAVPRTPPSLTLTMKFTLGLAVVAAAVASAAAAKDISALGAQRKLAFAPGYKGGMCNDMLCPDNYAPVCGSDGVTYSNECNLGITSCNHPEQNITMIGDGACPNEQQQQQQQQQQEQQQS